MNVNSNLFTVKISNIELQVVLAPVLLYLSASITQFGSWLGPDLSGIPVNILGKCICFITFFIEFVVLYKTIRINKAGIVVSRCFGLIKRTYIYDEFKFGYIEHKDKEPLSIYIAKEPICKKSTTGALIVKRPFICFPPYHGLYQILRKLMKNLTWNQFSSEILLEKNQIAPRTICTNRIIYYLIHAILLCCYLIISVFTILSERFFYFNIAIIFGLVFLYMLILPGILDLLEEEYYLLCLKRFETMFGEY